MAGEYGSLVDETISILENRERQQESDSQDFEEVRIQNIPITIFYILTHRPTGDNS